VIADRNVYNAINQISQNTVRNVVGRFSLDQLLSDTASINEPDQERHRPAHRAVGTQVTASRSRTSRWPDNMQRAMAKEAEAKRSAPKSSPPKANTRRR